MARESALRTEPAEALWRFAVAVYSQPGVSERCLALQDEQGVDVNILLFAAWLGAERGEALGEAPARHLIAETAQWREEIVQAMRIMRRRLKQERQARPDLDPVYQSMKAVELEAEKAEQRMLTELLGRLDRAAARSDDEQEVALTNMKAYLAALDVPLAAEVTDRLDWVAAAAAGRDRQE